MSALNLFLCFFVTLLLSVSLIPAVMILAEKTRLNDEVNNRSAHTIPIPRGGGLIFIFSSAILLMFNVIHPFFQIPNEFSSIILLSFACALLGFLDDKYSLPSWIRLLMQIALVAYPAIHLPLLFSHVPVYLQYLVYVVSWVWFINLFNFMDGTDGYASQEALFILLFVAVVSALLRPISICLMAAVFGFLKVNYPKASIFMGDAGSYFLGYLLFGLMIYLFSASPRLLLPCIIVSLLFTADATYTLIKRILKKESFFSAHRSHWYQRLYNIGYTHKYIFWMGVCINIILLFLALVAAYFEHSVGYLICSFLPVAVLAIIITYKENNFRLRNKR